MGGPALCLLLLAAQARAAEPWLRADVRLAGKDALWLDIRHAGWDGRTLEVSLSRGAGGRLERRLLTPLPAGGDKVRLDIPAGEGDLVLAARERATGRLVLEAPVELEEHGWLWCGPFPVAGTGHGRRLPPETGTPDFGALYSSEDGPCRWLPFDEELLAEDRFVNLEALCGPRDHAVAYVATVWRFPRRTRAVLKLGSDDSLEVFLNGRRVHDFAGVRGSAPGQDSVEVAFQPGENVLLLKVGDQGGAWGFHFRAESPDGQRLSGYEVVPQRVAAWAAGRPPRIVEVAAGRAVFEVGAPAPVPASARLRRALDAAADPRDWMHRGTGMALPLEVQDTALPGDGVLRTTHRFVLSDLAPGARYAVLGEVGPTDPAAAAPAPSLPPAWRLFRTPPPPGKTAVLHLRLAAVFFADVVVQGRGEERETPRAEIEEQIADALRDFQETVRYWFVHSGARLSLDVEPFTDWERHVMAEDAAYGFSFSGGEWKAVEQALAAARRTPAEFDSYLLVSCDRAWNGQAQRWEFPGSGGGTYGPLPPFGAGKSAWKVGCPSDAWMFCHEFHHAFDAMWHESGYPEFIFNHFNAWEDSAFVHGEHWDGNGWTLREWGGHARREAPGMTPAAAQARWFPADRLWRWTLNAWGFLRDYADADQDGLPDEAPELPLDEARFGSSPGSADSDGDGLSDLEELMRSEWLVYGLDEIRAGGAPQLLDPGSADSDSDGADDAVDPHPLWPVPADLGQPNEFVLEDPALGELRARVAWRDGALRVTLHAERGLERARVMLDADNDGWYVGGDNIRVEFDRDKVLHRDLLQCGIEDQPPASAPDLVPEEMFSVEYSATEGVTLTIRPRPQAGFAGSPGEEIGILIALDPGPDQPHGDRRTGMLTVFEPHTFFRTRLPTAGGPGSRP